MLPIPRRYSHYVFAVLQSGLTTFVATGIASATAASREHLVRAWLWSWGTAWLLMLPIVIFAAPALRRAAFALTRADPEGGSP